MAMHLLHVVLELQLECSTSRPCRRGSLTIKPLACCDWTACANCGGIGRTTSRTCENALRRWYCLTALAFTLAEPEHRAAYLETQCKDPVPF